MFSVLGIVLLASVAGGAAWLALGGGLGGGHAGDRGRSVPRVTMSLNAFHEAEPIDRNAAAVDAAPLDGDAGDRDDGSAAAGEARENQYAAAGLHPHPDPLLIEKSDLGPLPIIGKDGRAPWRVYGRPFSRVDTRPRIAVVVTNLGVSAAATEGAIRMLPGAVTFSFAPFTRGIEEWVTRSRKSGHEVLIDLPMEPADYPQSDPGPHTLLSTVPIDQNLRQLGWILSRATGYVGVSMYMGSGLADKPRVLSPILAELKSRGLMLVDTKETQDDRTGAIAKEIDLAFAAGDIVIDEELSAASIDKELGAVEKRARAQGRAVAIARPYPVTLDRLKLWSATLGDKGIVLAPISALPSATGKN